MLDSSFYGASNEPGVVRYSTSMMVVCDLRLRCEATSVITEVKYTLYQAHPSSLVAVILKMRLSLNCAPLASLLRLAWRKALHEHRYRCNFVALTTTTLLTAPRCDLVRPNSSTDYYSLSNFRPQKSYKSQSRSRRTSEYADCLQSIVGRSRCDSPW